MKIDENNPFVPVEIWAETTVEINKGTEKEMVNAKHYHVHYLVGESEDKQYLDSGDDTVLAINDKTVYMVPSIHRVPGEAFHYNHREIEQISGKDKIESNLKALNRTGQCEEHEIVEIAFQSPILECCTMTREEAEEQKLPVRYVAGYILGRSNGVVKIARAKTVLESGELYYENIHFIPESAILDWNCLE